MRPFRRRPDLQPAEPAPRRSASSTAPGTSSGEPAVHRGEWRGLPPIQRSVSPVDPTFGTRPFETGLATRQSPALLDRLGHFVAPDAPSGTFDAVSRPLGAHTFAPPPEAPAAASWGDSPHELPAIAATASSPERSLVTAPAPAPPVLQRRADAAALQPDRRETAGASPTPPSSSSTGIPSAPPAERPATPTAPIVSATPIVSNPGPPTTPVASLQRSAAPPATVDPMAAPPRRSGLGAPLPPGLSRLPTVQRDSAPPPRITSPAQDASTEAQPRTDEPSVPIDLIADDVAAEVAPLLGLRRLPTMGPPVDDPAARQNESAVQRRAASFVTAPDPFGADRGPVTATESGDGSAHNPVAVAPLTGDRLPTAPAPATGAEPGSPWPVPPAGAPERPAVKLRAVEAGASVQRTPASGTGRTHGAPTTATRSAATAGSGFVDAGAVAVAAGLAHRAPDGSVVFGPSGPRGASWSGGSGGSSGPSGSGGSGGLDGSSGPSGSGGSSGSGGLGGSSGSGGSGGSSSSGGSGGSGGSGAESSQAAAAEASASGTQAWAATSPSSIGLRGPLSPIPAGAPATLEQFAVQRARADRPTVTAGGATPVAALPATVARTAAPATTATAAGGYPMVQRSAAGSPSVPPPADRRLATQPGPTGQATDWAGAVQRFEAAPAPSQMATPSITYRGPALQREDAPAEGSSPPPAEPPPATASSPAADPPTPEAAPAATSAAPGASAPPAAGASAP